MVDEEEQQEDASLYVDETVKHKWENVTQVWITNHEQFLVAYGDRRWEEVKRHKLHDVGSELTNVSFLYCFAGAPFQYLPLQSLCHVKLEFATVSETKYLSTVLNTKNCPFLTHLALSVQEKYTKMTESEWLSFLENISPIQDSNVTDLTLSVPPLVREQDKVSGYPVLAPMLRKLTSLNYNCHGNNYSLLTLPGLHSLTIRNLFMKEYNLDDSSLYYKIWSVRHLWELNLDFDFPLYPTSRDKHHSLLQSVVRLMDYLLQLDSKPQWLFANLTVFDTLDYSTHREAIGLWRFYGILRKEWYQMLLRNKYMYYRKALRMMQMAAQRCHRVLGGGLTTVANSYIFPFLRLCPSEHFKLPQTSSSGLKMSTNNKKKKKRKRKLQKEPLITK